MKAGMYDLGEDDKLAVEFPKPPIRQTTSSGFVSTAMRPRRAADARLKGCRGAFIGLTFMASRGRERQAFAMYLAQVGQGDFQDLVGAGRSCARDG